MFMTTQIDQFSIFLNVYYKMVNPTKLIIIYILFSTVGWVYEYVRWERKQPSQFLKKTLGISLPVLQIYGIAATILYIVNSVLDGNTLVEKTVTGTLVITILECVIGLISGYFYGYKTWNYKRFGGCCGYISPFASLEWMTCIFVLYKLDIFGYINQLIE